MEYFNRIIEADKKCKQIIQELDQVKIDSYSSLTSDIPFDEFNDDKKLVDTNGNKKTAELKIGCTGRHINRLIKGYKEHGNAFFIHGNRGRKPASTIPEDTEKLILDLYLTKYFDCNLTHYKELLEELEDIQVSISTITSTLRKERILSPKANRSSKKALKKELQSLKFKSTSVEETTAVQSSILDLEDSHPRQPRCAYFGEMLQMDAFCSSLVW